MQTVVVVGRDDVQVREMSRKLHLSPNDQFLRRLMGGLAFRRLASRISKQRRAKFDALTTKQREADFAWRYAMAEAVTRAINKSVCKDGVVFHFDSPGGPMGCEFSNAIERASPLSLEDIDHLRQFTQALKEADSPFLLPDDCTIEIIAPSGDQSEVDSLVAP
jgi:phosphopantetheinyl transferase (holo-ACP synthase)